MKYLKVISTKYKKNQTFAIDQLSMPVKILKTLTVIRIKFYVTRCGRIFL